MTELPKFCRNGVDPPIAEPGGEAPAGASPIGRAFRNDSTAETPAATPFAPKGLVEASK